MLPKWSLEMGFPLANFSMGAQSKGSVNIRSKFTLYMALLYVIFPIYTAAKGEAIFETLDILSRCYSFLPGCLET